MNPASAREHTTIASPPDPGHLVEVRRRPWVVADVDAASPAPGLPEQHLVKLSSIDEDALGEECRKVGKDESFDIWLEAYSELLRRVARRYPNLKLIGTQLRAALSADRINWAAVLYDAIDDKIHLAEVRDNVEIADRTGGGDSFASGVTAALLNGKSVEEARRRLREKIEEWMKEEGIGGKYVIDVLCLKGD